MAQQKGHTGNPNGRPKGTPNKITSTIRNWIIELINDNREQIQKDLQSLEPKDRLSYIEKLLPYILPKVDKTEVNLSADRGFTIQVNSEEEAKILEKIAEK